LCYADDDVELESGVLTEKLATSLNNDFERLKLASVCCYLWQKLFPVLFCRRSKICLILRLHAIAECERHVGSKNLLHCFTKIFQFLTGLTEIDLYNGHETVVVINGLKPVCLKQLQKCSGNDVVCSDYETAD